MDVNITTMAVVYELPLCDVGQVAMIRPASSTPPHHTLRLSKIGQGAFLGVHAKFFFLFRRAPADAAAMKSALSLALVHYYPLAGRLKEIDADDDRKDLVVDCNDEGVLFVEAFMDTTADELLKVEGIDTVFFHGMGRLLPCKEMDKPFLSIPPLLIQLTYLRCGGMILSMAGNHRLADGIGYAQFLGAWAELLKDPSTGVSITPCWGREALLPPQGTHSHHCCFPDLRAAQPNPFQDQPLQPVSVKFGSDMIRKLKNQCSPRLDCTTFEILTVHVWRCFARAVFGSEPTGGTSTQIAFAADIRPHKHPPLPIGYYGNGIVAGVVHCELDRLVSANMYSAIRAVQASKTLTLSDGYVQMYLHEGDRVETGTVYNMLVSRWTKLGFEEVDFGSGRPVHISGHLLDNAPVCLILPVVMDATAGMADSGAVKVYATVPKSRTSIMELYLRSGFGIDDKEDPQDQTPYPT